jgi:hypothetical protein
MQHRHFHRLYYRIKNQYLTLNNIVIAVAFMIAAGWVWGSLSVMQRNYTLQQTLSRKNQELQLADLETTNLKLEQEYYKTAEYQELAARERLGKALPGEKLLVLPKQTAPEPTKTPTNQPKAPVERPSNFDQWMNFFFGRPS